MPEVHYRLRNGSLRTIEAMPGENLMQIAVESGVEGIIGRCGGFCNCATCHVYVDEQWLGALRPPDAEEDMILDSTQSERLPNSRLGCCLKLSEPLDGITVTMPDTQE